MKALTASDKDLVHKVLKDLSGHFKDAIKDLFGGDRDETPTIDQAKLAAEVHELYKAGEKKIGTDEKKFIRVLTNRSPWYNQALNQMYKAQHGHGLDVAIGREFSGHLKDLLVALLQAPYDYWATELYNSMHGAGTNDKELIFIFGLLEQNELKAVEARFNALYPKSLKDMIKGDTSGHYEKILLELLGHPQ